MALFVSRLEVGQVLGAGGKDLGALDGDNGAVGVDGESGLGGVGKGSDGGCVRAIMHHKHLQFLDIVDNYGSESMWVNVTCLLVGTIADARHRNGTLETTTDTSINTLGFPPGRIANTHKLVRLMPGELLSPLFDNSLLA